ncbi:protein REVEILLE 6-like isoform X2 [Salvia splendens]|uniref:protein REVEILLE 6-like isoform X2 n=1 Tax=Salvia splendens TaxID=180675 RepID=UPI001C268B9E|nr:protein REVEILLE 6-like isoform X2 [Salvia splendens]
MFSLNTNQTKGFFLDRDGMALPNIGLFSSPAEDPNKKIRKPYTITKSRESWTEPEHDKFLEALQLFDRDWKKIEAFIGSKTVIQIRSHAQKYFLKVQKSGTNEHLPPPRPKRKAAHPYPQKASKIVLSQERPSFQDSAAVPDNGFARRPVPSAIIRNESAASIPGWTEKPLQKTNILHAAGVDARYAGQTMPYICGSNDSTTKTRPTGDINADQVFYACGALQLILVMVTIQKRRECITFLPDFGQVYSFIGSVFDPNVTGHLQKLKKMDPIDIETVLLLMRNLSINLASRDFEDHRRVLSSYEIDRERDDAFDVTDSILCCESEGAG